MKRSPAARAIIYSAILGGLTNEKVNKLLSEAGFTEQLLPDSSFKSIADNEVKAFLRFPGLIGEFIYHPKTRGWLKVNGYINQKRK